MFCRKGATFTIPYRHKVLTVNKVNRAGAGLHPIRFDPILAQKLGLEEEIEILFCLPDAEYVELRRVVDYFDGAEA